MEIRALGDRGEKRSSRGMRRAGERERQREIRKRVFSAKSGKEERHSWPSDSHREKSGREETEREREKKGGGGGRRRRRGLIWPPSSVFRS